MSVEGDMAALEGMHDEARPNAHPNAQPNRARRKKLSNGARAAKARMDPESLRHDSKAEMVASPTESLRNDSKPWDVGTARRAIEEVNAECDAIELRGYDVGRRLNAMRDAGSAELLGYRTWNDLLDAEVRIHRATAFRYMAIAQAFTEQEFRELGVSRASIIVRLPAEKRAGLLPDAKIRSVRQLRAQVAEFLAEDEDEDDEDEGKAIAAIYRHGGPKPNPAAAFGLFEHEGVERPFPIATIAPWTGTGIIPGPQNVSLVIEFHPNDDGELVGSYRVVGLGSRWRQ